MAHLNIDFDNLQVYIFVFVRIAAIIVFNPVFSRSNIVPAAKAGLITLLTIIITPYISTPELQTDYIIFT